MTFDIDPAGLWWVWWSPQVQLGLACNSLKGLEIPWSQETMSYPRITTVCFFFIGPIGECVGGFPGLPGKENQILEKIQSDPV